MLPNSYTRRISSPPVMRIKRENWICRLHPLFRRSLPLPLRTALSSRSQLRLMPRLLRRGEIRRKVIYRRSRQRRVGSWSKRKSSRRGRKSGRILRRKALGGSWGSLKRLAKLACSERQKAYMGEVRQRFSFGRLCLMDSLLPCLMELCLPCLIFYTVGFTGSGQPMRKDVARGKHVYHHADDDE